MEPISSLRGYAIGKISQLTGVNIETIRYYERIAIMPKPDRTNGGNRQYNHDQLKRLSFIKSCRDLDFSLDEVRALLRMVDEQHLTCSEVHRMTVSHLTSIEKKLSDLKILQQSLRNMASECSKGDVPECPIIDTLFRIEHA